VLLVVDVQERLIGTIADRAELVENIKALMNTAEILGIPILMREQEKLGDTIAELDKASPHFPRYRKLSFSCCENRSFSGKLRELGRETVIVCGIETHICVLQTALELLERGYCVVVPKDATSSPAP